MARPPSEEAAAGRPDTQSVRTVKHGVNSLCCAYIAYIIPAVLLSSCETKLPTIVVLYFFRSYCHFPCVQCVFIAASTISAPYSYLNNTILL